MSDQIYQEEWLDGYIPQVGDTIQYIDKWFDNYDQEVTDASEPCIVTEIIPVYDIGYDLVFHVRMVNYPNIDTQYYGPAPFRCVQNGHGIEDILT